MGIQRLNQDFSLRHISLHTADIPPLYRGKEDPHTCEALSLLAETISQGEKAVEDLNLNLFALISSAFSHVSFPPKKR